MTVESDLIVYHVQTKLGLEIPYELVHDIDSEVKNAMRKGKEYVEGDKVKYFNELYIWAKKNRDEGLLTLIDTLKNGGSIR